MVCIYTVIVCFYSSTFVCLCATRVWRSDIVVILWLIDLWRIFDHINEWFIWKHKFPFDTIPHFVIHRILKPDLLMSVLCTWHFSLQNMWDYCLYKSRWNARSPQSFSLSIMSFSPLKQGKKHLCSPKHKPLCLNCLALYLWPSGDYDSNFPLKRFYFSTTSVEVPASRTDTWCVNTADYWLVRENHHYQRHCQIQD